LPDKTRQQFGVFKKVQFSLGKQRLNYSAQDRVIFEDSKLNLQNLFTLLKSWKIQAPKYKSLAQTG
jgi:hypothetical protein